MYAPPLFKNDNLAQIHEFIDENGFANLVGHVQGKLWASHIPLMFSKDRTTLYGHLSRGNQQWRALQHIDEVLAIFNGPNAYISSSWYDHENVPTWNYIAVHVYGKARLIEGEELITSLSDLTDKYEKNSRHPVSVSGMSQAYFQKELRGLVGIAIEIKDIEASYKLSQNRHERDHGNIIVELNQRNQGADAAVAKAMVESRKGKT